MIDPLKPPPRQDLTLSEGDKVFLCEGLEDCAVIYELVRDWERPPKIGTRTPDRDWGWAEEFKQLGNQVAMRRLAAIGFVFDAEDSAQQRQRELSSWYEAMGIAMPSAPLTLAAANLRGHAFQTCYIVNPHGAQQGSIETLFLPQMTGSPIWECVEELVACYVRKGVPATGKPFKTKARTYLAHGNSSNTGLNVAIRDKKVSCEGKEFDSLREFTELIRNAS